MSIQFTDRVPNGFNSVMPITSGESDQERILFIDYVYAKDMHAGCIGNPQDKSNLP